VGTVRTTTLVHAPVEVVYDLARDVGEHTAALAHTGARLLPPGRTRGPLAAGDAVHVEARHIGRWWRTDARVSMVDRPRRLVLVQERGPFRALRYHQAFAVTGAGTLVTDELEWSAAPGPLGRLVDGAGLRRYLLGLMLTRNAHLKRRAEVAAASR
jgi:ligand-binding SRPBCC domain-containing protein